MDPDTCLKELRALVSMVLTAKRGRKHDQVTALEVDMAEHVEALDEWISNGGFLPDAWHQVADD